MAEAITPANYETGLEHLKGCDLIIEAIAERMDWKQDLYRKIAPFVADHAVLASNTSGLGINTLAEVLPEQLRHRFCGVHFFNPPRYMHLAELIPAKSTDAAVLTRDYGPRLRDFSLAVLGKIAAAGVGLLLFVFALCLAGVFMAYGENGHRSAVASLLPMASSRRSTSVSTRLTKNEATLCTSVRSPSRSSRPLR